MWSRHRSINAIGQRPLIALGVSAQALHHLNYLIAEPIHAAVLYRSGVLVQIPRPERYENGSAKVCHGSGGIILLRAE